MYVSNVCHDIAYMWYVINCLTYNIKIDLFYII